MRRIVQIVFMIILLFLCIHPTVSAPSPVVRLEPATVELGPTYCVNDTFTLKAQIDDVSDLAQFGFIISWNTTYLEYVDHVLKTPVEVYPDGVLHEPVWVAVDVINATEGLYHCEASVFGPPYSWFNGSGTAFEITFNVIPQPTASEPPVNFEITFIESWLFDKDTYILHSTEHCNVTIYPHWNNADINDDLKVDIFDVMLGVNAYQATPSDPHWNPRCDIANPYDLINIFDIVKIVGSYGEEYL